jgi:hypothetical protein
VVNLSAADVTGAQATTFVFGRGADLSNYYMVAMGWSAAEVVTIQLHKRVAGALSTIGSSAAVGTYTAAATTPIAIDFYLNGSDLKVNAWTAADPEPAGWMIEETDASLTAGGLAGLIDRREAGNTNAGLQFAYDTFSVAVTDLTAVEQDAYPPRVLLSLTDLVLGDSVELYRVVGGERTAVRAGADDAVTDSAFLRIDAELPFGVPVSYVAVVNGADEYTAGPTTYTLPGGKVAISDAISGDAAEVVIMAWPDKQYARQSSVFRVGGRNVAVLGELGMATGEIELYTETTSGRDNLHALLASATEGIVQIRQPGGYDGIDSYQAVLAVTERRWSPDGTDQRRTHILSAAEVEAWAPALEASGFTLQDIADAYDGLTLNDLAGDYATLLDVAQGDFSS